MSSFFLLKNQNLTLFCNVEYRCEQVLPQELINFTLSFDVPIFGTFACANSVHTDDACINQNSCFSVIAFIAEGVLQHVISPALDNDSDYVRGCK